MSVALDTTKTHTSQGDECHFGHNYQSNLHKNMYLLQRMGF